MDKLTVCLINDSFPPIIDGVANAVVNYAHNIEKNKGRAIVAVPAYPGADDSRFPFQVVRFPSVDIRKVTTGYTAGIPFSPELTSRLAKQNVDIIHAHCPMMSALLARSLRKRTGAPTVITYHTKYDIDIANVIKNKALQNSGIKSVVTNVSSFDDVWVVSDGAGKNLKSLGYQGDYVVMPNGVDISKKTASLSAVKKAVNGYDLPEGVPVFLFVGRLMWYKGIKIILDALRMISEQNIDFRMVMVGTGGDAEEIRTYTLKQGLSGKVFFTGTVTDREEIRAWYTRADLFLFPSTFDSNGLVVREAAACSLPSVLIDGSCAAEGVTDGHNAFLIEENAWSMAELLKKISGDRALMGKVGENAGNELYISWEDAVRRAIERYKIVLELQRIGAFDDRRTFSDNLLLTQGDLMYTVSKVGKALNQGKILAQYFFYSGKDQSSKTRTKKVGKKKSVKTSSGKRVSRPLIVAGSKGTDIATTQKINRAIRNSKNIILTKPID